MRAREIIACPLMAVVEVLLTGDQAWLGSFLRIAASESEREVGPPGPDGLPRAARVAFGESVQTLDHGVSIPVTWRVQGYRALPPFFDGALTLTPTSDSTTSVTLAGSWPVDAASSGVTDAESLDAAQRCVERLLATLRIALEEAATATRR